MRRLVAYGRWGGARTPIAAVRVHVMILQRFGYTYAQIARRAGIQEHTVYRCMNHRNRTILADNAARILAIAPSYADLDPGTLVPAEGTRRRLQALACLGWSGAAIAAIAGVSLDTVHRISSAPTVRVVVRNAITAAYDRLWNQEPPTDTKAQRQSRTFALHTAQAAGWVPPLAWDDIDTDPEPQQGEDAGVDEIAIALAVDGQPVRLTREERHIALRELHAFGHLDSELAARLGVDVRTIDRDRKLLGLPANYWTEHEAAA
ncbi:hypothetical protein CI089_01390 [Microbacterium sp. Yaish 1]|nr:hypothetical protein CI089_01390 [Microbacterium sp. Yaish 1]